MQRFDTKKYIVKNSIKVYVDNLTDEKHKVLKRDSLIILHSVMIILI